MAKKTIFIVIGICIAIAAIAGIIVGVTMGNEDTSTSTSQNGPDQVTDGEAGRGNGKDNNKGTGDVDSTDDKDILPDEEEKDNRGKMPTSDPDAATTAFSMLAIGDWGATTYKEGSCCNKYRKNKDKTSVDYQRDYHAQINIATLMSQSAAEKKPEMVMGHGDNVYWNGVGPLDAEGRMHHTFDEVYNQPSLKGVPWVNVAGNHDIGGSMYICGEQDNRFRPCKSSAELIKYLDLKFNLQRDYKSPDNNRWIMSDHYYKKTVSKGGVSVDIFNIDTNYADSHAAHQVCCQCYGYSDGGKGVECNNVQKGDKFCAGGDIAMYSACMAHIKTWWDDSVDNIQKDLKTSTATFKIVNTHYSPHFHMGENKMKLWYKILADNAVHAWFNGHTHGFNHDISKWETHFFENGGGGGIQSETSGHRPEMAAKFVDTEWIGAGDPYGFFELSFSEDWLKVQFVTFDQGWKFSLTPNAVVPGGLDRRHCWHIPRIGGPGKECAA